MPGDSRHKVRWEHANVVVARAKINRNQDRALFDALTSADNIGTLTRELLRLGLAEKQRLTGQAAADEMK